MASATISVSLLAIAVTTAYLVKASVMQRTHFFLLSAVSIGQKGRRESGGLDSPESGVALAEFVCWLISFFAGSVDKSFDGAQCLVSKIGSGNFEVRLVGCIVSPENTVMGLAHSFFLVPGREVKCCPGVVEIV